MVYTGTHDNETVTGWFSEGLKPEEKEAVRDYFCDHTTPDAGMHIPLICAAMRSVSKLCIIPMQDLLGYGNEARMNAPSTYGNNWKWRLLKDEFGEKEVKTLYEITKRYGNEVATFYNIFCAGTTVKFMQPGTLAEDEAFLAQLVREDAAAVRAAFDVISGDLAKLARRIIAEAGVTGIYFSLQNLIGEGASRAVYEEVFAPGEKEILRAANAESSYNILHICGYAGHRNALDWYRDYDVKTINWAAVVEGVPLEEGRKIFPEHALLGGFGNLASDVLYRGTQAEITAETHHILDAAGRTGILLGADCTVPRDIDWKHFDWVRDAAGQR